jgi:hypothetical protein
MLRKERGWCAVEVFPYLFIVTFPSIPSQLRSASPVIIKLEQVSTIKTGARGGVVVKALRYKLAGRGFDSRLCH